MVSSAAELGDEEQKGGLSWEGVVQGRQTIYINMDGVVGTVERGEEAGAHSLELGRGPASVLVVALLDWTEDKEDEVTSTTRGLTEHRMAQDPRGEEKAEPRAAGQTNEG
ncbi:hypothetical protein NDU88_007289 [Pleurodeles waltl]|uniref:Uncharacterized protein n=1 Tax=Pleurodeles waltl TaxID=8319 RepID=A0AAV7UPP0_PLEWA|nr:hypothetical protein NDU88_007289 [Pleurodeles waltl]